MDFLNRLFTALTELHPIHPMVVHFPIALTGAAFLFILLAYLWKNSGMEQAAFFNIILAAIGTVVAAATGIMDNQNNYDGTAPNAQAKMILAVTLFLLTTSIAITRYRKPQLFQTANGFLYAGAYGLCFAIALVLAFLGGVILYGF
jgi:uncharacterized membrane protein